MKGIVGNFTVKEMS